MPRPNKNSTENQARLGLKSHSKVIVVRFSPINLHRGIDGLIKSTPQQLDLVVRDTPLTVMLISDAAKTSEIYFSALGVNNLIPIGQKYPSSPRHFLVAHLWIPPLHINVMASI